MSGSPRTGSGSCHPPLATDVRELRTDLLGHYDRHRRPLPWRDVGDPYAVWVSEVMLQQTRVDTVIPYYERWLTRFPTVEALADAELDDVLESWSGLGYYARARRLHAAARRVCERRRGRIPETADALRALPGVGEYTAGAIASIAFGQVEPAVDGNVRRVLSRLFDLEDPSPARLRTLAAALVDPDRPGDFNQALMELGATVCTPANPSCPECPWRDRCRALRAGTVPERPARRRRLVRPHRHRVVWVALTQDGRTALVRRPPQGLLGGMWEFPGRDLPEGAAPPESDLAPVNHGFSHRTVTYCPFVVRTRGPASRLEARGHSIDLVALARPVTWLRPEDAVERALPAAQRKILASLLARSAG